MKLKKYFWKYERSDTQGDILFVQFSVWVSRFRQTARTQKEFCTTGNFQGSFCAQNCKSYQARSLNFEKSHSKKEKNSNKAAFYLQILSVQIRLCRRQ